MADLHVNVAGVAFNNPLIAASGTFGFGREYAEFYPLSALGGISSKGITLKARPGNPAPRIAEAPGGMLNAVGLQNPGVDHFIREDLPWLREQGHADHREHRRQHAGGLLRDGGEAERHRRRHDRAEHLLPEREAGRRAVRHDLRGRFRHHEGRARALQKSR